MAALRREALKLRPGARRPLELSDVTLAVGHAPQFFPFIAAGGCNSGLGPLVAVFFPLVCALPCSVQCAQLFFESVWCVAVSQQTHRFAGRSGLPLPGACRTHSFEWVWLVHLCTWVLVARLVCFLSPNLLAKVQAGLA